jgi:hypothetical protein
VIPLSWYFYFMSGHIPLEFDPVSLGHKAALGALRPASADDPRAITAAERVRILNQAAFSLGFFGEPFWVEARKGVALPNSHGEVEEGVISLEDFGSDISVDTDLEFTGAFSGYSRLRVGAIQMIGATSLRPVRGLCVVFDQAFMMRGVDILPEDHQMHVPILAVEGIGSAPQFR